MAPAELRGVWQMRVNGITSVFILARLDVGYSNRILTVVLPLRAILVFGSGLFACPESQH